MSQALALIVDDEPDILELLGITLARMDISSIPAGDLSAAKTLLDRERFDLCLTDMRLPDGSGIELVRHINAQRPEIPVAVITAHGNMESAIEAMKAGAFDFVSKPVDLGVLRRLVTMALKLSETAGAPSRALPTGHILLGTSSAIVHIHRMIAKLARSQAPVYISGESGTGKELVARLIHEQSHSREGDFVAVNCGAIPQDLMEGELFGHRKGSFTGAISDREGLFQAAEGGTLFLDEVADLPLHMQVKLLRAIQEKSIRPIGAQREVPVDVRIISATHKNLREMVERGEFRQDLFYRINVIELPVPPLRERTEDIPLLAAHVLACIADQSGSERTRLTEDALNKLKHYPFPGNVRELENILERAIALREGDRIGAEDLQLPGQGDTPAPSALDRPLEDFLGGIEKQAILQALEETRWNRTAAARKLGMSLRSLRYRLGKLGLQ